MHILKHIHIFKTYKLSLIGLGILTIVASITYILTIFYSGVFIDTLVTSSTFNDVLIICLILFAITFLNIFLEYMLSITIAPTIEKIIFIFKKDILQKLVRDLQRDIIYTKKQIDDDTRQIVMFFINNYTTIFIKSIELILVTVLLLNINTQIGLIMIIMSPMYFLIYVAFKKEIYTKSLILREANAKFFSQVGSNIEIITNKEEFNDQFTTYLNAYKDNNKLNQNLKATQNSIVSAMQVIIFFVGGMSVINGYTTIGMLTTLMAYFNRILANIGYYTNLGRQWQVAKSALHRIETLTEGEKLCDTNLNT